LNAFAFQKQNAVFILNSQHNTLKNQHTKMKINFAVMGNKLKYHQKQYFNDCYHSQCAWGGIELKINF
jgi:hypothetical protein